MVTNSNILQYLDAIAQYRLSVRVRHEVDAFLAGLNDIIPDNLLCIFDENELEVMNVFYTFSGDQSLGKCF